MLCCREIAHQFLPKVIKVLIAIHVVHIVQARFLSTKCYLLCQIQLKLQTCPKCVSIIAMLLTVMPTDHAMSSELLCSSCCLPIFDGTGCLVETSLSLLHHLITCTALVISHPSCQVWDSNTRRFLYLLLQAKKEKGATLTPGRCCTVVLTPCLKQHQFTCILAKT